MYRDVLQQLVLESRNHRLRQGRHEPVSAGGYRLQFSLVGFRVLHSLDGAGETGRLQSSLEIEACGVELLVEFAQCGELGLQSLVFRAK